MDFPLYGLERDDSIPFNSFVGDLDISDVAQIRIEEWPGHKWVILTLVKDNGDVFEINIHGICDLPIYAGDVSGRVLPLHRYVPVWSQLVVLSRVRMLIQSLTTLTLLLLEITDGR